MSRIGFLLVVGKIVVGRIVVGKIMVGTIVIIVGSIVVYFSWNMATGEKQEAKRMKLSGVGSTSPIRYWKQWCERGDSNPHGCYPTRS